MKPVLKVVLISILASLAFTCQVAISFLPNIELVSLLFIIYANYLNKRDCFAVVLLFSALEGIVWGFGDWVIGYLWIWPIEMILAIIFKPLLKDKSNLWAIFSAFWAVLFGVLFSIQHAVLYGINAGYAYWLKGLTFDIIHIAGNYTICLTLFTPLTQVFCKLYKRLNNSYGNNN